MPPDLHLFSALLGNRGWVSEAGPSPEGFVKLTWLLRIPASDTDPPQNMLSAWRIVLCGAFLFNREAFFAHPGLWKG